ncbi:hypothetical protein AXE80_04510 [Wenyingzhuangia fucanilytica]|uniref:Cell surface protein n=1 Tax=Wenyingzhuangia fucanilytica TaxID=1790137 RepID=A0A1B1Y484_9FLAO|nr:hypothetical protein [Wenyingzhuangia fucanilytica]ANW95582.1 hypothetical protein AXE80_04510 [Wenyingzhuangia fucanilytica]
MNNKHFLAAFLGLSFAFTSCEKSENIESMDEPIDVYNEYARPITSESNQYISNVLSYRPGPGQYINKNIGNIESSKTIIGNKTGLVSLGAWGGSIVFTFDHTIVNRSNNHDFIIYGNAFSGFSEPGIVQVSFDENGNGLADDSWYEIAGSAHQATETLHQYEVTYTNPKSDTEEVIWKDNVGNNGSITASTLNKYPLFIEEQNEVTYSGTRIFPTVNSSGFISTEPLDWGYVDNYNTDYKENGNGNIFDIDWAVDKTMNPVTLKGIDFIKVYTGAQVNLGFLGELSTELKGAADLSLIKLVE